MDFKAKVVWITGASSGIGEHFAYAFAEQGARLVLSARNEKELLRVKNNCPDPKNILIIPLDVINFDAIPAAVQQVIAHFGQIHILINNAGISQRASILETKLEVDQHIMGVNYFGKVAMAKAVLPVMIEQGFGQIVVISSVLGYVGVPYRSAYAAAKHALHGYFDTFRSEMFRHNLKVTIICPGYIHTNVTINALKGDGSKNNVMAKEQVKGMDPTIFAHRALRAIAQEREEVLIGGKETLAIYVKRFLPGIFSYFTKRLEFKPEQR